MVANASLVLEITHGQWLLCPCTPPWCIIPPKRLQPHRAFPHATLRNAYCCVQFMVHRDRIRLRRRGRDRSESAAAAFPTGGVNEAFSASGGRRAGQAECDAVFIG